MKGVSAVSVLLIVVLFGVILSCSAQNSGNNYDASYDVGTSGGGSSSGVKISSRPDVFLDANVTIATIQVIVSNLQARLNLDAKVSSLVSLTAGVDVSVEKVNITIKGVRAKAQLRVHLDNVVKIVEKALETIEEHPELITSLVKTLGKVVTGLLGSVVNALGQTLNTLLDTTGNIVQKLIDPNTGETLSSNIVGNVLKLDPLEVKDGANGTKERLVYDPKSNALIKVITNAAGDTVLDSSVVESNIPF